MPARRPSSGGPRRLILACTLCLPAGLLIEPSCEQPLQAAFDHALECHLDELLADQEDTLAHLRVVA